METTLAQITASLQNKIIFFEFFHDQTSHKSLSKHPACLPVLLSSETIDFNGIKAPEFFQMLRDSAFQMRVCESGGIIALRIILEQLQEQDIFIGLTTYKERFYFSQYQEKILLERLSINTITSKLSTYSEPVIAYWCGALLRQDEASSAKNLETIIPNWNDDFLLSAECWHPGILKVFNEMWITLLGTTLHMPSTKGHHWIYRNYWIMSKKLFFDIC